MEDRELEEKEGRGKSVSLTSSCSLSSPCGVGGENSRKTKGAPGGIPQGETLRTTFSVGLIFRRLLGAFVQGWYGLCNGLKLEAHWGRNWWRRWTSGYASYSRVSQYPSIYTNMFKLWKHFTAFLYTFSLWFAFIETLTPTGSFNARIKLISITCNWSLWYRQASIKEVRWISVMDDVRAINFLIKFDVWTIYVTSRSSFNEIEAKNMKGEERRWFPSQIRVTILHVTQHQITSDVNFSADVAARKTGVHVRVIFFLKTRFDFYWCRRFTWSYSWNEVETFLSKMVTS